MKKLNVHVITKYFYPVAAGIETNILETYSMLANKWNITLHTSADEYTKKNSLPKSEVIRGLQVKRYPFINELLGYLGDIEWEQADIIALHNFNVYFWRYFVLAIYHKLIGKKKYRLILTPHGGFCPEWTMFPFFQRIFKRSYHRLIGSLLINYVADEVRAVSSWEKAEMIKLGIKKNLITTITNGLENEAFMDINRLATPKVKQFVKELGPYIIQVGRIYPIKNYETVIRALPSIPKVKYLIIGQVEKSVRYGNYQQSLIDLATELGVADRLVFGGVHRGVDKYYLIKHAQLMVHMAIWESFCNVVHEGMSQGLVCIVANNTALPFLIKEKVNGYLVNTFDSVALAKKINFVLTNKDSKEVVSIKNNNADSSENESWSSVSTKMEQFYAK